MNKLKLLVCLPAAVSLGALAADVNNALRGSTPLDQEGKSPPLARVENTDIKRTRNYTDQPPTIPHKIDGYEISLNVNKCMMCHSRERTEEFQAPMVSATHFMNRDYDYLAQVSPRRYFCTQCHVPQTDARVPLKNTFEDVDTVIARKRAAQGKKK
jgi:nitrate reductase (cytochrome), electron transfer subunit